RSLAASQATKFTIDPKLIKQSQNTQLNNQLNKNIEELVTKDGSNGSNGSNGSIDSAEVSGANPKTTSNVLLILESLNDGNNGMDASNGESFVCNNDPLCEMCSA